VIDAEKELRDYLTTVGSLTAVATGGIYASPDLPPGYTPANGPALLFGIRGGSLDYSAKTLTPSFQFRSFAATRAAAQQLDAALHEALEGAQWGRIKSAFRETPPQAVRDPETGWVYVLSFFRAFIGNP
jgi:hypothetical protein